MNPSPSIPSGAPAIGEGWVRAFTIPTDAPESDGTLAWDSTTLVLVQLPAGDRLGLGYSYTHVATAGLIRDKLLPLLQGRDPFAIPALVRDMRQTLRNLGDESLAAMAVAACDNALYDLKAKLLDISVLDLLGASRESIPGYGSGGFTSYDDARLRDQLGGWAEQGFGAVKMKISRQPDEDPRRVESARDAIGPDVELMVDSNGALDRKRALATAHWLNDYGVTWYEEPVWRRDLEGLKLMRDRAPAGMEITAGEYGFQLVHLRDLVESGAVDVLQADATRCGATDFLNAGVIAGSHYLPFSAHTAPALHAPLCCALDNCRHLEYFHDHARIEAMLFDGGPTLRDGVLIPDRSRPGFGLELKEQDAAQVESQA